MRRLIINGVALSEPGTMGGNSKIVLEIARNLAQDGNVHLVVPATKLQTVHDAIGTPAGLTLHTFPPFPGNELRSIVTSARYFTQALRGVLQKLGADAEDILLSGSDFHTDTLPAYALKREFGFTWIAAQYLFVPFIIENLRMGYRFPAFKYFFVWLYSNLLFRIARQRADAFVITNHSDLVRFPKAYSPKVFPFYGGVNTDQIPQSDVTKTRDVVFCSRLHPQKGIDGFLDTWKQIHTELPAARLTVIGNGAPAYEAYLREKSARLGIAESVDWLGYVNNAAKYAVYRSACVMVHPTVFDNNGMVAAEALCSGLPVVMYDLPALRHVYTDGCVKVPFGNKTAFAKIVVRMLTDAAYRDSIAPRGEMLDALCCKWAWPNRVALFKAWLTGL